MDLIKEGAALEPGLLLFGVEDREIGERLGQDVDVILPRSLFLPFLLHDVSRQERVFWGDQPLSETLLIHFLADRGSHSHFKGDDLFLGDVKNDFTLLDVSGGMDTSVIL